MSVRELPYVEKDFATERCIVDLPDDCPEIAVRWRKAGRKIAFRMRLTEVGEGDEVSKLIEPEPARACTADDWLPGLTPGLVITTPFIVVKVLRPAEDNPRRWPLAGQWWVQIQDNPASHYRSGYRNLPCLRGDEFFEALCACGHWPERPPPPVEGA